METSQAQRWKQQNALFLWANSVEHINTFLAVEGARFPAIFGFFRDFQALPDELLTTISIDELQDAKRDAKTRIEM
jgi:hypothetical protein